MKQLQFARVLLSVMATVLAITLGLSSVFFSAPAASAAPATVADPCATATYNAIACENTKPGTPESVWDVGAGSSNIQGFATDISVDVGSTINFKIDTKSTNYTITIYRMGYYQGDGARQITTVKPSATLPQNQPACLYVSSTGLTDCGNWAVSASWAVPSTAISGIYFADLIDVATGDANMIPFIVRNDASHSDIVFKTDDTTWEAYNDYGGNSLYYGNTNSGCGAVNQYTCGRAYAVSYNRPFNDRSEGSGYGTANYLFYAEYPMVRWLEANGYDTSYISSVDTERAPSLLLNHKVILSAGHDEYWSAGEMTAMTNARDAGVDIASFTGNTAFWKTRWQNSIDGSNTPYRTMVSYKETLDNKVEDPMDPPTWTGSWQDARFSPPADGGHPANALLGTTFLVNRGSATPVISSTYSKLRFWRNTAVASLTGSQTVSLGDQTIGYEWDGDVDNGFRPAGLIDLSTTSVDASQVLQDQGNTYTAQTVTYSPTMYKASSGALVFSAATVEWSWGLDTNHDTTPDTGPSSPDPTMQQVTVNVLADMHVQPSTLQSGLVAATASTDMTAPTSTITAPAAGGSVTSGVATTITGTATDAGGGVVAGIEVSVDGGTTWHKATLANDTASTTWSYSWVPKAPGTTTIKSRAVDDSTNLETPSAGVSVTVNAPACPCSLFPKSAVPTTPDSSDSQSIEVGVRFTADSPGYINGIKFYKSSMNTGTHTGSLWTASGARLATGTFTNETASGWQTLTFTSPVSIQPNTPYIASYHTTTGHYSADTGYFSQTLDAWPLHAPSNTNGVYAYGASQFPSQTYGATNYWVDVVYNSQYVSAVTPAVAAVTPTSGATGIPLATAVSAGFNKDVVGSSIQFSLAGPNGASVAGSTTYNSTTYTAIFTPSSPLSSNTTYTATVQGATDPGGATMAGPYTWSFTTHEPCPCSLFASTAAPTTFATSDVSSVELGVRFSSDVSGYINGVRYYKASTNTGTHTGSLWSTSGQLLATATFTNETTSGWQQVYFSQPIAVAAGTTYIASYHTNTGNYAYTQNAFTSPVDSADLHAPASTASSGNGLFAYGASQFPNQTYSATNYWVDVIFNSQYVDPVAPSVNSTTPPANANGVSTSIGAVTATFSKAVEPSSIQFTVTGAGNTAVPGAVSYDSTSFTATFTPSAPLAEGVTYTASVGGAANLSGVAMANPYVWSFTTAAITVFPSSAKPSTITVQDSRAAELGMKFTSDVNGKVLGVRFYKGPSNTGSHVGNLWSSSGQLLATVTFTNETASGWQQAMFSQPVAITADTTYVVSYHTNAGYYSADAGYFSSAVDSAPLHGLANGTSANGVYGYGATQFPTSSYDSTNYWVDVVFIPS